MTVETDDVKSGFLVADDDEGIPQPPFDEGKPEDGKDVQHFATRPDLRPPEVEVTTAAPAGLTSPDNVGGFVFVAPKRGPTQEGPMILDRDGEVVWFHPVAGDQQAFDFRVQQYEGRDVLTWWQGAVALYRGFGTGRMLDSSYREIARVEMANGYEMDAHEFELTDRGTALVMAYVPVRWDTVRASAGGEDGIVEDCVIQEIDVETGALLFEWHALGSIRLGESYRPAPTKEGQFHDPYHFNSIQLTPDGDYLVSARHTSALYKIDGATGAIVWRLGGKRSDFKLGPGARFNLQHDARMLDDGTVSLFDNVTEDVKEKGALSRGLVLRLDSQREDGERRARVHASGRDLGDAGVDGDARRVEGLRRLGRDAAGVHGVRRAGRDRLGREVRARGGGELPGVHDALVGEARRIRRTSAARAAVAHLLERGDGRGFVAAHAGRRADGDDRRATGSRPPCASPSGRGACRSWG